MSVMPKSFYTTVFKLGFYVWPYTVLKDTLSTVQSWNTQCVSLFSVIKKKPQNQMFICTTENVWNAHTAWGLAKLSPAIGWSDEGLYYQGETAQFLLMVKMV